MYVSAMPAHPLRCCASIAAPSEPNHGPMGCPRSMISPSRNHAVFTFSNLRLLSLSTRATSMSALIPRNRINLKLGNTGTFVDSNPSSPYVWVLQHNCSCRFAGTCIRSRTTARRLVQLRMLRVIDDIVSNSMTDHCLAML